MVAPSKKAKRNQKKRQNRKKKQQQQREEEEEERLRISQSISTSTSSGNSSTVDDDDDDVNDEDADNGKNTTNEDDKSATITTTAAAVSQTIDNSEMEKEKEIPPPLLVAGSRNDSDVNLLDHIPEDSRSISTPTRSPLSSTNSSIMEEEEEETEQEQAEAEVESSSSSSPSSQSLPPVTLQETTNSEETGPPPTTTSSSSEETVPTSNTVEQTTNNNNVECPPSPSPMLTPLFATDTTSAIITAEMTTTTTPISPSNNFISSTTSTICSSQNEQDQNVTSDVDDDDIEDLVDETSPSSNKSSSNNNSKKIPTTAEQNPTTTTTVVPATTTGGLGIMRAGGGGTTTGIATTVGVAGGMNLQLGLGMMTMGGSGGGGGGGITADTAAEEEGGAEGTAQELKLSQEAADVVQAASLSSSVATTTGGELLSIGAIQTDDEVQDENEFVKIDQMAVDERNVDDVKDNNKNMDNNDNDSIAHQQPMDLNTSPTPTPTKIYDDNNEESMGSSSSTSRTNNPEIMKKVSISNNPPVNYDVTKSKSLSVDILSSDDNIINSSSPLTNNVVDPTSNDTKKEEEEEEVTASTPGKNNNDDSMKKEKDDKNSPWSELQADSKSLPQQATTNDVDSTSIEQKEEEESDKQKHQQQQQQQKEQSPSDNIAVPTGTFDEGTVTASTQIQSETDILPDENDDASDKKTFDSDSFSKIHKQCNDDNDNGNNNSPNATIKEEAEAEEIPSRQRQQQLNKDKLSPWDSMRLLMTDMETLLSDITDKEDESKNDLRVEERIQNEEGDKGGSSIHASKNNENDVTGITSTSSSSSVLTEDEIKVTAMVDTMGSSNTIIASEDVEVVVVEEEARGMDNQTTPMTMDSDGQTEAIATVLESIDVKSNETDGHRELESREDSNDRIPVPQCKDDLKTPVNEDSDVFVTYEAADGETDKETPESCSGSSSPVVDTEPDENDEDPAREISNENSNQQTSNNVQETTSSQASLENNNRRTSNTIKEITSSEPKEDSNHLMPAPQQSDDDAIENKGNGLLAANEQSTEEIDQQTPIASSLTVVELDKNDEDSNAHDGKGTAQGPETSGDSISPDVDVGITLAEIRKSVTLDHDRTIVSDAECAHSRNQATSESSSVDVQQNGNGIETDDQQRASGIDQPTTLETKEEDLDHPIHLTRQSDEDTTCNKEKDVTMKPIAALSVSDSASTVAEKPEFDKTTASSAADDEVKKDALLVDLKDALASFRQKKADIEALVSDCETKIQNEPDSNDVKDFSSGKVNVDTGDSSVVQGTSTTGNIEAAHPHSRGNGASVSGEILFGGSGHSPRNEASMKGEEELVDSLEIIRDSDRSSIKEQVMDSPSQVQETNHQTVARPPTNSAGPTKNESKESSIGDNQEVTSHSSEGSKISETPTDCVPNDCTPTSPTHRKRSAIISTVSTRIDCLQATSQAAETKESIQDGPKNDSSALSKVNNVPASAKRDELATSLLENQLPSSVDSGSIRTVTIEFFDETETSTIGDRTLSPIEERSLSRVSHSPANEDTNKREDLPSNKSDDLALSMHSLPNGRSIEKYSPITPKVGISTRLPPVPLSAPPKLRSRFAFSKPKRVNRLAQIIRTELWSEDIKIVEAALLELEKLAEKDSATIARTGGILAIVQVMEHHIDQPEIQVAACQALEKLALDHENEVAISEVGGLEAVISSMMANFEDDTVHEAAWSALWNLTCHHADLSIDIEDGLQALTSCMTQHSQQPSVQRNACGTLANLCQSPDRLKALRNAGGFVAIATALEAHWDDEQVRLEASNALTTLLEPHTDTYELHLENESPSMYKFTPNKSKVPSDPPDAPDP